METAQPPQGITVERPIEFHPPEAQRIAHELSQCAQLMQELAGDLHRVRVALDNAWEGHARNRFFDSYDGTPRRAEDLSAEAQAHAGRIRGITVTIVERVWVPGAVAQ